VFTKSRPRTFRAKLACTAAALTVGAVTLAGCGGSSAGPGKNVLTIAYGSTFVFATAALAPQYYGNIAREFEAAHPGVTVKLIPIAGSPSDIVTKLSLLYRSPSTAPTITQIDSGDVGLFAEAGYFLPLNSYVSKTSWWQGFPQVVKNETTFGGKVYAVNQGENVQALAYNKIDFRKAGLPVPWHPRTWQDIINAALTIKKKLPGVTPVWAEGGTGAGTVGVELGVGNLLAASSDPTVFDQKTGKWVIDSAGLRQTFAFIHTLAADNLNAPVADLFNPNAPGNSTTYMMSPGAAIALASNYWGASWLENQAPAWPKAAQAIGIAPLPTVNGQGSGTSSLITGWDQAIYSHAQNPALAWQLLDFMMQKKNLLAADNDGEFIPPDIAYAKDPLYLNFGAPFQAEFAKLEPYATEWPGTSNLPIWSEAFQQATGALEQNPGTSVSAAVQTMKTYISEGLGPSDVESQP
jgi:multiple sugar transport system substrate-binding protein